MHQSTWQPSKPFCWHVKSAIDIVNTLQSNNALRAELAKMDTRVSALKDQDDAPGPSGGRRGKTGKKRSADRGSDSGAGPSKAQRVAGAEARMDEFRQLAKRFNRSFKCRKYVGTGLKDLEAHKKTCKPDPGSFKARMGQVKKMLAEGRGKDINVWPKGNRE